MLLNQNLWTLETVWIPSSLAASHSRVPSYKDTYLIILKLNLLMLKYFLNFKVISKTHLKKVKEGNITKFCIVAVQSAGCGIKHK